LIDGLAEHYNAAVSTREQLIITQRALQARLAEARRRKDEMDGIQPTTVASVQAKPAVVEMRNDDCDRIEDELAALKRELDNDNS
jgi:pyridoxine/pyridoxamine 5'-phosphate oxidase